MHQDLIYDDFRFVGKIRPPATGATAHGNPWVKKLTGSCSVGSNNGVMEMVLDATNEVQNACLSFDDDLSYAIDKLVSIDIWAKCTGSLPAAVTVSFGLATARNDAIASITNRLLWQLVGDNNVKLQATDGTNTLAATAVGQTLTTTMRRFQLDLGSGILTRSAPNLSLGGKANVLARMDNGRGDLRNVLPNSPINLSALTSNVQPFFQVQKTSGTAVATFSIERVLIARRI